MDAGEELLGGEEAFSLVERCCSAGFSAALESRQAAG
jgi:hypothetical protein